MKYNETAIEPLFDHLVIQQFGEGRFIEREPTPADIQAAHEGLEKCRQHLMEGKFDMVILDELTIALYYSMLSLEEVLNVLRQRLPSHRSRNYRTLRTSGINRYSRPRNKYARSETLLFAWRPVP